MYTCTLSGPSKLSNNGHMAILRAYSIQMRGAILYVLMYICVNAYIRYVFECAWVCVH